MSAWRTQRRTDSTEMSKSAATSAWLRSPRRATRTTSRLNSGGNFFGTATSSPRDLVPQKWCQLNLQQSHNHAHPWRKARRILGHDDVSSDLGRTFHADTLPATHCACGSLSTRKPPSSPTFTPQGAET